MSREQCEKLKKFEETKERFMSKKLKEKSTKRIFYVDKQEVFRPATDMQKKPPEETAKSI